MTTDKCNGHDAYYSRAEADAMLRSLVAHAKHTGHGGKSWKRLNVWECGNHYHIGRANSSSKKFKPETMPKPPTAAQLRRAGKRLEKDNARTARHALNLAGWNIQDLDVAEAHLQDQLHSLAVARQILDEIFSGKRTA
jgi:hypothetical protein